MKELLEMKLPQLIASQKKTVVAMASILCVLWLSQAYISEWFGKVDTAATGKELVKPASDNTHNDTPLVPISQPNGIDPFKEFMSQQASSSKPPLAETPSSTGGTPADPFKAYLENQKQQLEAARVSPFGK